MMAKERAKVASGKHARHLKGNAITVGNGATREGLFHVGKNHGQEVMTGSGTIIAK